MGRFERWSNAIDDMKRQIRNLNAKIRRNQKKLMSTTDIQEKRKLENYLKSLKSELRVADCTEFELLIAPFAGLFGKVEHKSLENGG